MRKIGLMICLMLIVTLCSLVFAQNPTTSTGQGTYMVQKGDTLWWLEGYHRGDPTQWRKIVNDNPFLKEPGRIFTKGEKTIALIKPGEELKGLVELGILPYEIPLSEIHVPPSPQVIPVKSSSGWWYVLLGLVIAVALYGLYRFYRLFSNPATSGQAIVQGGLSADRPRDVETRFQRIAESRVASGEPLPQRVGPIEEGFLSGYGRVQYRDLSEMKRLHREPAFRARFRFHNGVEENLFFLQACANDVTFSGIRYFGFTFEPGRQVVAEPQIARPSLRVAAVGEGLAVAVTKFRINDLEITVPEGSVFSLTDDKVNISISRAGDIAIGRLKKTKKAKAVKSVATTAS